MALDKLLENEARSEIDGIRAEAQERARAIISQAQEDAQSLMNSNQQQLEKQYQAGLTRARSAAELELNAARLSASDEGISQVFTLVEEQLNGVTQVPQYREILGRLIAQAREAVPVAEAIEVHPDELEVARSLVTDLPVRPNPSLRGGVRVVGQGGKSGLTNTLSGRLERLRGELTPQVGRLLTGE
ncbi:V-type ATP synthase subunit E [Deinococcus lacus]|uniref:V-type proton ATPase subunit E n=1 Tax=Deinococcus lacus TaxID=392561 RepID=A0ABW1YEW2_9DEIO